MRECAFRALAPPRVISLIRPENAPSKRVAERIGMRPIEEVQFRGLTHVVFGVARSDRGAGGEGDVS